MFSSTEMSPAALVKLCKENGGYTNPELNTQLPFHCRGFTGIKNLEPYKEAESVWLQQNAIGRIEGLENLEKIRMLYLQENCIQKIENISHLRLLTSLNVSNNWLKSLDGVQGLPNLETLQASHNKINSLAGLEAVTQLPNLQSLDVSTNKIQTKDDDVEDAFVKFFARLPGLSILYAQGNEGKEKVRFYRKKMIAALPGLKYLDDKPVSPNERRLVDAWARGGAEEESKERDVIAEEKNVETRKDHEWWNEMKRKGEEKLRQQGLLTPHEDQSEEKSGEGEKEAQQETHTTAQTTAKDKSIW